MAVPTVKAVWRVSNDLKVYRLLLRDTASQSARYLSEQHWHGTQSTVWQKQQLFFLFHIFIVTSGWRVTDNGRTVEYITFCVAGIFYFKFMKWQKKNPKKSQAFRQEDWCP